MAARASGTGTTRTTPGVAGTARMLRARKGMVMQKVQGARASCPAASAARTARTGAAGAPGTQASCRPAAAGTGSAARAAPAGPAPRWGDSLRSSDGVSWHCRKTVTGAASQAAGHSNIRRSEISSEGRRRCPPLRTGFVRSDSDGKVHGRNVHEHSALAV